MPNVILTVKFHNNHQLSAFTRITTRILLSVLAFLSLHQVALIYTPLGRFFKGCEHRKIKDIKAIRPVLQTILFLSMVTLLLVVGTHGSFLRLILIMLTVL